MKKITLLLAAMFVAVGMNAQYCTPTITNNCTGGPESILNVTFQGINNTTSCELGVSDYTDQIAEVTRGGTHEISVSFNTDPDFPDDYVLLYIDWNQNQMLDDPGEFYVVAGPLGPDGFYVQTYDVSVPANAELGETRMRILINWNQPAYNGCDVMNYGEIEDYTVNVIDPASVNENSIAGFSFFPNPTVDVINLKAIDTIDTVKIFNLLGQSVMDVNLNSTNSSINVSNLETGLYLMSVTSGNTTEVHQIVKK